MNERDAFCKIEHSDTALLLTLPNTFSKGRGSLKQLSSQSAVTDLTFTIPEIENTSEQSLKKIPINLHGIVPGIYEVFLESEETFFSTILDLTALCPSVNQIKPRLIIDSREITKDGILLISGCVINIGDTIWDINNDCSDSPIIVGLRLFSKQTRAVVKESRCRLDRGIIKPQERSSFIIATDVTSLPGEELYEVQIDLVREGICWASNENPPYQSDISIPYQIQRSKRELSIKVSHLNEYGDSGLYIEFDLINTGSIVLDSTSVTNPYFVKVFTEDVRSELRWSGSARLNTGLFKPGDIQRLRCELVTKTKSNSTTIIFEFEIEKKDIICNKIINLNAQNVSKSNISKAQLDPRITKKKGSLGTVIWVSLLMIEPDKDTNSVRTHYILKALVEFGFEVHFLYQSSGSRGDLSDKIVNLEEIGIKVSMWPLTTLCLSRREIDPIFIFSYFHSANVYMDFVKNLYPNARCIVDTVDVHWVRLNRGRVGGGLNMSPGEYWSLLKSEKIIYGSCEELWVVSNNDQDAIVSSGCRTKATIAPLTYVDRAENQKLDSIKNIVFIGNYENKANIEAVFEIYSIMLLVRQAGITNFKVKIVGPSFPSYLKNKIIEEWMEFIPYEPLIENVYKDCSILLAPLRYGAGVKGKIIEAISFGLCIITSDIGNEGIDLIDKKEGLICQSNQDFANAIIGIHNNESLFSEYAKNARERILPKFSYENLKSHLLRSSTLFPSSLK